MSHPILITGGAGYIGSHVAWECVERGYEVMILDDLRTGSSENIPGAARLYEIDLGDQAAVWTVIEQFRPKSVLHLAGSVSVPQSIESPIDYYRNNVSNSIALIDSCVRAGVRNFIFSSTAAVYGPLQAMMIDETAPLAPASPYGRSKMMVEWVLRDAVAASEMRAGILRYFNVAGADLAKGCGPRSSTALSLMRVAARVATGELEFLPLYGVDYDTPDGTCIRDFIDVRDLADAHFAVLDLVDQRSVSVTLNCGYGRPHSILDVVAAFERVTGSVLPVRPMPRRAGDIPAAIADSGELRALTGWSPRFESLDQIAKSTLEWERFLRSGDVGGGDARAIR